MKDEEKYQELMAMYLAGEMTSREKVKFMFWVEESAEHQEFFAEMVGVWSAVQEDPIPDFNPNMDAVWGKIDQQTTVINKSLKFTKNSNKPAEVVKIIPLWQRNISKIAVAAGLILGVGLFLQNYLNQPIESIAALTYHTGEEEQMTVDLPDGSQVSLNENTQLIYSPQGLKRAATLTGEAFFAIERDEERPFEIISGATKTVVLGTSFNVRAYPHEPTIEVSVASGKVAFIETKASAKPIFLEKGARGVFNKQEDMVVKEIVASTNANAWKTKHLNFNDETMQQVIPTLERYFEVDLQLDNLQINLCSINGDFKHPELDEILQVIAFTIDVQIEKRADGTFVLSGNGCE